MLCHAALCSALLHHAVFCHSMLLQSCALQLCLAVSLPARTQWRLHSTAADGLPASKALAEGAVLPSMAAGSTHEVSLAELVPAGEVVQAQKLAAQKKQLAAQAQQRAAQSQQAQQQAGLAQRQAQQQAGQAQRQAQQQGQQRQTTCHVVDLTGESPRSVLACKGAARRSRAQVRVLGRTGAAGSLHPCLCLLAMLHCIHAADTAFCTASPAPVTGRDASSGGACWAQQAGWQHRFHGRRHHFPGSRPRRASKHWAALRRRCRKHQGCGEWQAGVGVRNAFAAVDGCPAPGRLARFGTCLNCAWSACARLQQPAKQHAPTAVEQPAVAPVRAPTPAPAPAPAAAAAEAAPAAVVRAPPKVPRCA